MKTRQDVLDIVNRIVYKDWKFRLQDKGDGWLIQATFLAPDIHTGADETQYCRKFYISSHACDSEIIRTAYLAIQQAEAHEMNEQFKFDNVAIFDPHLNYKNLAANIDTIGIEAREPRK